MTAGIMKIAEPIVPPTTGLQQRKNPGERRVPPLIVHSPILLKFQLTLKACVNVKIYLWTILNNRSDAISYPGEIVFQLR